MSTSQNNRQHESHNNALLGAVVFAIIIAMLVALAWMSIVSGNGDMDWYLMPLG